MRESEKRAIERCFLIYDKSIKINKLELALKATELQFEIEKEIEKRELENERIKKQKSFRDEIEKADRETNRESLFA